MSVWALLGISEGAGNDGGRLGLGGGDLRVAADVFSRPGRFLLHIGNRF